MPEPTDHLPGVIRHIPPAPYSMDAKRIRLSRWLLGACIALFVGLLVVGLWPFNFLASNRVYWPAAGSGLRFERQGQVYSASPWSEYPAQATSAAASFSVELWLESNEVCDCLGTILSWYQPSQPKTLKIEQSLSDLVVRGNFIDGQHHAGFRSLWLDRVLQKDQVHFLTVTTGPQGTVLYLEGRRIRQYPYTAGANNFGGRFVLGHSTVGRSAWAGVLLGLAIYDHVLAPEEVSRNYQAWRETGAPGLKAQEGVLGLYAFDEGRGDLIHNHAGSMPDLVIPARFSVLHKDPLVFPLKLYRSDLKDAVINIVGFVPFGCLVCAYLQCGRRISSRKAILLAVIFGGLTSLQIELLQVYLPSRDSSGLDVINNVLGSGLGALVSGWLFYGLQWVAQWRI